MVFSNHPCNSQVSSHHFVGTGDFVDQETSDLHKKPPTVLYFFVWIETQQTILFIELPHPTTFVASKRVGGQLKSPAPTGMAFFRTFTNISPVSWSPGMVQPWCVSRMVFNSVPLWIEMACDQGAFTSPRWGKPPPWWNFADLEMAQVNRPQPSEL